LANNIKEAGGIIYFSTKKKESHALANLLDKDTETYGQRGDRICDQLRKKVQTWVKWSQEGKYAEKVLNWFKVKAAKYRTKQQVVESASEGSDNKSDTSSISSLGDIELPKQAPKQSKKQDRTLTPPPTHIETSSTVPVASPIPLIMSKEKRDDQPPEPRKISKFHFFCFFLGAAPWCNVITLTTVLLCFHTVEVKVNPYYPEENYPVFLWGVDAIPGVKNGSTFAGYAFMLEFDPEWAKKDKTKKWYRATVLNDDTVSIEVPGWRFAYMHERETLQDLMEEHVADMLDNERNNYVTDPNFDRRHHKEIHLKFPSGHRLTAKSIHSKAGEEERLPVELIQIKEKKKYYLLYQVARLDIKYKKKGKIEDDQEEESDVYALIKDMEGMDMDDSNAAEY
jgi:hypothetical protein